MGKTPYELRLDLLSIAKDTLENKQRNRTTNMHTLSSLIASDDWSVKKIAIDKLNSLPDEKEITTEDILIEANKLYSFVQKDKKETK
jgi:hypothetical protein